MTGLSASIPPDARHTERYWRAAAEARSSPGAWALVRATWWPSLAHSINEGRVPAFRPVGSWHAITRASYVSSDGSRRADIWVQFIPTQD